MEVRIIRKKMRSIRLHVTPEGEAVCTASVWASDSKIQEFIKSKQSWLEKAVERARRARQNNAFIRDDSIAKALGFTESDRKPNGRSLVYSAQWKKEAMAVFEHTASRFLYCFTVGTLPQFAIKGRSMRSMWGNCNTRTKTITLNWELLNFPQECVDYVVLHEMTHFLYIHHDKNFYSYIARYMPDYKKTIKMMR